MMSISTITSSSAASSYYEVDDYYTEGNAEEHTKQSEWHGKGAVLQGLDGSVKPEDFSRILDGIAPDGTAIGRMVGGERQHRPGIDLTFTPPKSVAIMAQVAGDKRIIEAHKEAVKETLSMIEEFAAKTRVGENGVMKEQNTGNLTIATFNHTSTRAQDPGFHTHAVIANMTLGNDGKWRSLHNDAIWENSKARYGENYSMRLAEKLSELGYEIVARGKNAEYEIAGVSQDAIDYFSTRGRQIKELLEERGLSGPINREWAALHTREKKVAIDKQLEEAVWKERAAAKGYDFQHLIDSSMQREKQLSVDNKFTVAIEGVKDAVEHLSQRQSAFTVQEVVQSVRNLVIGKTSDEVIYQAVESLKQQEFILHPNQENGLLTTRDVVAIETDNLARVEFGKGVFKAITSERSANKIARKYSLNSGQSKSLVMAATSKDRVNSIQGWAGVGKTHYGRALNELLTNNNYRVVGLSPSAQAANELEKGSGIASTTLASYIFRHRDRLDDSKFNQLKQEAVKDILTGRAKRQYIVVDESSFVSSKDFNSLLRIAESFDARVLKIGDYKQLGAVDAGAPHKQVLDHGVTSEKMNDIIRQKNNPALRDAVYAAIDNKPDIAMQGLNVKENDACVDMYMRAKEDPEYRISFSAMRAKLAKQAAETYANLTPKERANTALIVQNNDIRVQVNELVREALVEKGEIARDSITVESLKNVGLTDAQMRYAHNYQNGHVVRFNSESSHFGIAANDYYRVKNNATMMAKERYVTLVSETDPSKEIIMHPRELATRGERGVEVFESSEREIAAGDKIRWTRNDKDRDIINTQSAIVLSVSPESGNAEMLLENGETRLMNMRELQNNHLDYSFANTAHAIQGATVQSAITVVESWHKLLTNMRSFYVGISRASNDVTLITDDAARTTSALINNVQREDIALTLFERDQQPLDFNVLHSIKDQLEQGVTVRDLYLDLVVAFDGDRYAAQKHLQELGLDGNKIERDLVIENIVNEMDSNIRSVSDYHNQQDSQALDRDMQDPFNGQQQALNESSDLGEQHSVQKNDEPDWFAFDEVHSDDADAKNYADDGLDEVEQETTLQERREIDLDM